MIKKENAITLLSLVITIALMLIIASTTIGVSLERFEVNNFKKMLNDIELLEDKVQNYYLQWGGLPVLRENNNTAQIYTYTSLNFNKNSKDNSNYYILDLEAIDGVSLNYGKEGFENPNQSNDVYIINELTHTIYYVKGIELSGTRHHYIKKEGILDNIPPSKPEIKIVSGKKNENEIYTTDVEIEIIPGKDSWSGVNRTTYSVNGSTEQNISTLTNNIYKMAENGTYNIVVRTEDNSGNFSQDVSITIIINKENVS